MISIIDTLIKEIEWYECDCQISSAVLLCFPHIYDRIIEDYNLHDIFMTPTMKHGFLPMDIFQSNFARIEYLNWLKNLN